jgi:hypothetical protein
LKVVGFRVYHQNSYQILANHFLSDNIGTLAAYILDVSLFCSEIRGKFDSTLVAHSCIILAHSTFKTEGPLIVTTDLAKLKNCVSMVRELWMEFTSPGSFLSRFMAMQKKY